MIRDTREWQPNRSLADDAADALRISGQAKARAHAERKKADRIFDACLLKATGSSDAVRRAQARLMQQYIQADETATEFECSAITTKAEADAALVLFENYRTEEASRRYDRSFIAGQK